MQKLESSDKIRVGPPSSIADTGQVRLGGFSASFPPTRAAPKAVVDAGKVRMGGFRPAL